MSAFWSVGYGHEFAGHVASGRRTLEKIAAQLERIADGIEHQEQLLRSISREVEGPTHTPNGYDVRWIDAINGVLHDREADIRVSDINDAIWTRFIGPMIDRIEDNVIDQEELGRLSMDETSSS